MRPLPRRSWTPSRRRNHWLPTFRKWAMHRYRGSFALHQPTTAPCPPCKRRPAAASPAAAATTTPAPAAAVLNVRTDVLDVDVSLQGGELVRADLLQYRIGEGAPAQSFSRTASVRQPIPVPINYCSSARTSLLFFKPLRYFNNTFFFHYFMTTNAHLLHSHDLF